MWRVKDRKVNELSLHHQHFDLSAFTLLLRGEFLIIFLFSLTFLVLFNKKKLVNSLIILLLTIALVSPYLIRNYKNTGNIHLVNVTGYALWKGNNQLANNQVVTSVFVPQ